MVVGGDRLVAMKVVGVRVRGRRWGKIREKKKIKVEDEDEKEEEEERRKIKRKIVMDG